MLEGGLSWVKFLLFGFNVTFFLCGSGVLGVGIWLRVEKGDYVQFTNYEFASASNLTIASGVIIILVTFLGVVGSIKELKIMLLVFFIALLVIFCLEVTAGVLAYSNRNKIETKVRQDLNATIHTKYGNDAGSTKAIDKLQDYFKCCGNTVFTDWTYSQYFKKKLHYPQSCCVSTAKSDPRCFYNRSMLKKDSCFEIVKKFLMDNLLVIGIASIVVGVFQILGMICSMLLFCGINDQHVHV